jgi:Carboxypeptidase regulatory-like domain/TonB-dependent Receptor Plug Domain
MRFARAVLGILLLLAAAWSMAPASKAQAGGNSVNVGGTVTDQSGAVIPDATVTLHNPVSGFQASAPTDASGNFTIPNVPFNPYHMTVTSKGFAEYVQDVDVRSAVPLALKISLQLAGTTQTVTVEGGNDLIESDSTAHIDIDRKLFNELPLESQSSSLSSLVTLASPGVAADSNGLFHGLGDHAENSFSVDGQPITDQQSKVFSNQIPVDAVQSLEVIDGAPPAEYGDKTSVVIDVTTRSGEGMTTPHGDVTGSYGSFGSSDLGFNFGYGGQNWGNFLSASGLNTSRFLDPPEFVVMHDKGNEQNIFDRVDYRLTQVDSLQLNLGFSRSWFQTPNSYDSQLATPWLGVVVDNGGLGPNGLAVGPADQHSQIRTYNVAPTWTRIVGANTVFTLGAFVRHDQYDYYPSGNPFADLGPTDLQRETVRQFRLLTNAGVRSDVSYVKGIHNIKAGITYQQTFLTEDDHLGIVDPTLNAPCLDLSNNPVEGFNDSSQCAGAGLQPNIVSNPNAVTPFSPLLACYDLTRATPSLADGCAGSASALFQFLGHTDVKELGVYVQDTITKNNWTFNLGIRGDLYNGLTTAQQAEPRLGVAYNIKQSNTVLKVSYARTLETPFNENLVLSSIGCSNPVLGPIDGIPGSGLLACGSSSLTPLSPGFRNEFHAGLQQAFGKHVVFDGEYIWKYTHNGYDFSVLGNTPITFPIEWHNSKIPGFTGRLNLTNLHGITGYVVMSSVAARFFTPQIGGAGAVPVVSAPGEFMPFRIDHDQRFNSTAHLQYQPSARWPWIGFNWRYDSGLVAGPAPCAGGNCANGPDGTGSIVDVSGISPDQQFEAGLFCGAVHAAPPSAANPIGTPISSALGANLCPASEYGSNLVKIPAAGTEDDDKNPPRIQPRNLFDLAIGDDNIFRGDRYKWSARVTIINLANQYALYNFLSTFSGTHYVTPRTVTAQIGFHF